MKEFYMNDRISGDNHAIVRAGMCTALVVVLSLLGFYMPLLSTVVFLLIPLPIAYLGMKEGVKWSLVVTTGVLVLDSTFSAWCPPLLCAPSSAFWVSPWVYATGLKCRQPRR